MSMPGFTTLLTILLADCEALCLDDVSIRNSGFTNDAVLMERILLFYKLTNEYSNSGSLVK